MCSCPMPIPVRTANGEPLVWRCANCNRLLPTPDPRDAEIARLKADLADTRADLGRAMLTGREIEHENNRLRAALAAGPAALRAMGSVFLAEHVEAAQEAAMKGGG
mgnify:CR=1 FL=1